MPPHNSVKNPLQVIKQLRQTPTEDDARRFIERLTYRYLNRVLDEVIRLYNIPQADAEILRDRLVNMNLIEALIEEEDDDDDDPDA
jgi:hypothetical protein